MGQDTEFVGHVTVEPPLNEAEIAYLERFNETRRMSRSAGPYFVDGSGDFGQGDGPDTVLDHNAPPEGQPSLWCHWVSGDGGSTIEWDECEKTYEAHRWMVYLIQHFLRPGALATGHEGFEAFQFNHVLNGTIEAYEEDGTRWRLVVRDNEVFRQDGEVVFGEPYSVA